jgi:hypothetical protein
MVTIINIFTLAMNLILAGLFVLFGVMGRKRYRWLIVTGMILYTLDGLSALLFKDWMGTAFHGLALFGLFGGLKAINSLIQLEKTQTASDTVIQNQLSTP